ncbi:MAG: histidine triad nucleotide-binding protein [Pseudomonadota bacterium]
MSDCIFCRLAAKEVPADILYEDEECMAFRDIFPKAKVHYLIIPKVHLANLDALEPQHSALLGRLMLLVPKIAKSLGLSDGYRTLINTGPGSGQEVYHLHIHLLSNKGGGKLPGF